MTRSIYPVKLHALEHERHVLVVRKLQLENRIRQIKDQIRDARDRGVPIDDVLVRERDEVNTALHEVAEP